MSAVSLNPQKEYLTSRCHSLILRSLESNVLGFGHDSSLLIRVITSLTRDQLVEVDILFRRNNPQNLSLPAKLKNLSGSYGNFLSSLSQLIPSFNGMFEGFFYFISFSHSFVYSLAGLLDGALTGMSADIPLLNEVICLLPHETLVATAEAFSAKFNSPLRDRLLAKLSGNPNYLSLLTQLLHKGRNEDQTIDEVAAAEQARQFATILAKKNFMGSLTDDGTAEFITLLLSLSYSQCQVVKVVDLINFLIDCLIIR